MLWEWLLISQEEWLIELFGLIFDGVLDPAWWWGIGAPVARALNPSTTAIVVNGSRPYPRWRSRAADPDDDPAGHHEVRQRDGCALRAAVDTVERTGVATLVVERDGHVLYRNDDAERLLCEEATVRLIGGKLVAGLPREATHLAKLIRGAVDGAACCGVVEDKALKLERQDRLPLTVLVAPLQTARAAFGAERPAALVVIRDPERLSVAANLLRGLFRLTVMEARIAASLCRGKALGDISREHGISINTAKTHLKGALLKTGTRRQAELVALLLRSVAVLERAETA